MRYHKDDAWDTALYTSPAAVSRQEHSQIESRLSAWADMLNVRRLGFPFAVRVNALNCRVEFILRPAKPQSPVAAYVDNSFDIFLPPPTVWR